MTHRPQALTRAYHRSQVVLYSVLLPMALLAFTVGGALESTRRFALVLLGFSTIVFVHELGHFLVARACSVRCEAFSIGIGPRLFGWRKNFGLTFGNDRYDALKEKVLAARSGKTAHESADDKLSKQSTEDLANTNLNQYGECDYRISMLPLGGYVRMLGQDDMDPTKVSQDPRAFNQRPVWQRMCIVSAGVIMNIIFAAIVFSIVFGPSVGVPMPPAQVGMVALDSPAYNNGDGIKMGDRIVSIDGQKTLGFMEFSDVVIASALSNGSDKLVFEVVRPGVEGTLKFALKPVVQQSTGFLGVGIEQMPSLNLFVDKDLYLQAAKDRKLPQADIDEYKKFQTGDSIVAINSTPVANYLELYNIIQASHGQPVTITVKNKDAAIANRDIRITPMLDERLGVKTELPSPFGIGPRTQILSVEKRSPAAKAGLKPGDIILAAGSRTDPSVKQLMDIISASADKPLSITVLRDSKRETLTATPKEKEGKGRLGIGLGEASHDTTVVLRDPTAAAAIETLIGNTPTELVAVDGKPLADWNTLRSVVRAKSPGESVKLTFKTTSGEASREVSLDQKIPDTLLAELQEKSHYNLGLVLENQLLTQKAENSGQAVMMGLEHTVKFVKQVYMTLKGMIGGTVSPSNLHGIIVIGKVGHDVQDKGFVWLCYLMAMVSVNLAVANFLPLPVVDGGLFLLLILEKIRGKPLSLKTQSVIQYAGVVLLGCLFLLVTYNDILFLIK